MDAISDMGEVAIYNLYEMRVEDAFNAEIWSTIISHASALVFQFPFYWMSAPSLLKRWLDEVFTYLAKTPAVAGKTLMVVTTAGSVKTLSSKCCTCRNGMANSSYSLWNGDLGS